jgi:hypothetical protein
MMFASTSMNGSSLAGFSQTSVTGAFATASGATGSPGLLYVWVRVA